MQKKEKEKSIDSRFAEMEDKALSAQGSPRNKKSGYIHTEKDPGDCPQDPIPLSFKTYSNATIASL